MTETVPQRAAGRMTCGTAVKFKEKGDNDNASKEEDLGSSQRGSEEGKRKGEEHGRENR